MIFFDPQHRENLDKLKYGNEGARQRERCALPAMTGDYIDTCCREAVRALTPSGYLMLWENAFGLVQGHHLRLADVLQCVDLIAWDNQHMSMGYRARRRGDYLIVLQKTPIKAKATWRDHGIPDRWVEKIDRELHPHVKPIGLITRLISAITEPGDLIVDPAAGSFVVMRAALELGREFVGCDITYEERHGLAAFPSPESMAAQAAEQVMPAFVFARRRDIELEAGFTLAGNLIIDVPKRTKLKKRHKRMFQDVVKGLIKMVVAGQMPDDAIIYGWPNGGRPANADAITDDDEIMTEWARTRHHIVVRVDPRKDDGSLRLDSDIAKRLGLISVH